MVTSFVGAEGTAFAAAGFGTPAVTDLADLVLRVVFLAISPAPYCFVVENTTQDTRRFPAISVQMLRLAGNHQHHRPISFDIGEKLDLLVVRV
jgi:hypothetical protein